MIAIQKRVAAILAAVPEIAGSPIICEDKADLVGNILAEINKNTALCIAVDSARGSEAANAEDVGLFTETVRVSFFASMLAKNRTALLPMVEAAIRALHEARLNPDDPEAPLFRVTGHEKAEAPPSVEAHAVTVETLWVFKSAH